MVCISVTSGGFNSLRHDWPHLPKLSHRDFVYQGALAREGGLSAFFLTVWQKTERKRALEPRAGM